MSKRFASADLPDRIPVFPLPGALLLPRARLPLNIFEPRYLAMLDDTLKTDQWQLLESVYRLKGQSKVLSLDAPRLTCRPTSTMPLTAPTNVRSVLSSAGRVIPSVSLALALTS